MNAFFTALMVSALVLLGSPAQAHDPSAWGGAFRTRDFGGSWLSTDAGLYVGAAMALAIHPKDPNHLLYATDTRLLRSRNGGRDWQPEGADVLPGPVTAVAFDIEGNAAVASNAAGVFHHAEGQPWQRATVPASAVPARRITAGTRAGEFVLAGATGLHVSRDGGARFERRGEAQLPDGPVDAITQLGPPSHMLVVLTGGRLWRSDDGAANWQDISAGLPSGRIDMVAEAGQGNLLVAAAADALYLSPDQGTHWARLGERLPEQGTTVRGLAVSPDQRIIVIATHRGVLRSEDGGSHWQQTEGSLPVHLEAGLMMRDPHDAETLYTGFALTPYPELYRRAQQGSNLLSQLDPVSLAGGAAFFTLMLLAGVWSARKLFRGSA